MELEKIKEIFLAYKNKPYKSESVKEHICDMAREYPSEWWHSVFAPDKEMFHRLRVIKVENLIHDTLINFVNSPTKQMANVTANLAKQNIIDEDYNWLDYRHQLWLKYYQEQPLFLEALSEKYQQWRISFQNMLDAQATMKEPVVADIYEIIVPSVCLIELEGEVFRVSFFELNSRVFEDVIYSFDRCVAPQYLAYDKVQQVELTYFRDNWIIRFKADHLLTEQERLDLKNDMLKNLKNWGAKMQEQTTLVGCMSYSVGFDTGNVK